MWCFLHQTLNCSDVHCQNVHDPNPAQDELSVTSNFYLPGSMLQNTGPIILGPTHFFVHSENSDGYVALYDNRVRVDPDTAISLTSILANGTDVVVVPNVIEANSHTTDTDTNANRQSESLLEDSSSLTNSSQPAVSAPGSHARRRYNYNCVVCNQPYDRAQRARDCANRDRGLTPHACSGQCGIVNWFVLCLHFPADPDLHAAPAPTALKRSYASILLHQRIVTSNAHNA